MTVMPSFSDLITMSRQHMIFGHTAGLSSVHYEDQKF